MRRLVRAGALLCPPIALLRLRARQQGVPGASRLLDVGLGGEHVPPRAEVIFVPFSTDEKRAYHRVRATAQARCIENSIYTVIAANVGNLPGVKTYLLNYGQSAVFAPSDFAFPIPSLSGEADPGVETVVIADLDFASLAQIREFGSVRPLHERRPDIYDLQPRRKIKVIKTE